MATPATVEHVKQYWESHPLLSYELENPGEADYFIKLDQVKSLDSDLFALAYWQFDGYKNKTVLDVGCGPGWLTVQYAQGGAKVSSIDLTAKAVELTKKHLQFKNLTADVREGNAEDIEFHDNTFDLVVSSGVLHHTPDTYKCFTECYRVLKPGGSAKITLYHKGILHKKAVFRLATFLMKLLKIKHPGADLALTNDVDEFIRQYDGFENPVGIGKTTKEWSNMLKAVGFTVIGSELHFFPKRFLPFGTMIPKICHYWLDRYFGTMIYFELKK